MSARIIRLAATAGAAAILGVTGIAAGAASAATDATPTSTVESAAPTAADYQFIAWYPSKAQCAGGGEYYVRHGYSSYICQLDPWRGWGLFVK